MHQSAMVRTVFILSFGIFVSWPLRPALGDKPIARPEDGVHPRFGLATPSDGPFPSDRFTVVRSLGSDAYYTLMSRASAVVGNSSSGIIEAASFRLPVVDVGDRQRGRIRGSNVISRFSDPVRWWVSCR